MKNKILFVFVVLLQIHVWAQEKSPFQKSEKITRQIDSVVLAEKKALKDEILEIEQQQKRGSINLEEATALKKEKSEEYANRINEKVEKLSQEMSNTIQEIVDQRMSNKERTIEIHTSKNQKEKLNTLQLVLAAGVNQITGNNQLSDNLNLWKSRFLEIGATRNTRLSIKNPIYHLKYGVSLLYNSYSPEDNQVFATNGNQTYLEDTDIDYKTNRLRNFYINIPVHFELDFSPRKNLKRYHSHQGWRIGLGGYMGFLVNSKNFIKYKENGEKVKIERRADYNVHNFNYGLSGYIGHKQLSLYTKYDLQSLFEHQPTGAQNLSIGIRWDIN